MYLRKLRPGIVARNGIHFPEQPSTGNCVPDFGPRVGCRFRLGPLAEAVSQIMAPNWDELSQRSCMRKLRPRIPAQNGMRFPVEASAESASQNSGSERDALSEWHVWRKLRPSIWLQNGIHFPEQPLNGNCVPDSTLGTGCCFRLSLRVKSAPQNSGPAISV